MKSYRRSLNSILIKTTQNDTQSRYKAHATETKTEESRRSQARHRGNQQTKWTEKCKKRSQDWNHKPNRILHKLRKVKWVKIKTTTHASSTFIIIIQISSTCTFDARWRARSRR